MGVPTRDAFLKFLSNLWSWAYIPSQPGPNVASQTWPQACLIVRVLLARAGLCFHGRRHMLQPESDSSQTLTALDSLVQPRATENRWAWTLNKQQTEIILIFWKHHCLPHPECANCLPAYSLLLPLLFRWSRSGRAFHLRYCRRNRQPRLKG